MKKPGRPTKYKPAFCQKMIDFFNRPNHFEEKKIPHYKSGKKTWNDIKRFPTNLPTMVGFARHIKVGFATVYTWMDPQHASFHKEFLDTFTHICKPMQKDFLIQAGLQGYYNPLFAKFVAINISDMKNDTPPTTDKPADVKIYIANIIKKAGIDDKERETTQGHQKSTSRLGKL